MNPVSSLFLSKPAVPTVVCSDGISDVSGFIVDAVVVEHREDEQLVITVLVTRMSKVGVG
jgi:hypothetical protein